MSQRLLLVSPVRNEQAHIECVAEAVAAQTRPPDTWLLVDDGSTDDTRAILERLSLEIPFVRVLDTSALTPVGAVKDRLATAAEARAFNLALTQIPWREFTHVAKLDGDIELPRRYFEVLLGRFASDPSLGLAGGMYADPDGRGGWKLIEIPSAYHVPGALKCYSTSCLQAIDGIREQLAWDTIDESYARMRGFATRSYADLLVRHHRPWGSADGTLRGRARHGRCAYLAHFTLPWVALRSLKVARNRPRGLSGAAFLCGYLNAAVRREARVEDPDFRRFVRRELRGRLLGTLRRGPAGTRSHQGAAVSRLSSQ